MVTIRLFIRSKKGFEVSLQRCTPLGWNGAQDMALSRTLPDGGRILAEGNLQLKAVSFSSNTKLIHQYL